MKSDKVIVKKSNIEGKGVFAIRDFKKGEIVLHWDISNLLSKEKLKNMTNEDKKYISFSNGNAVIMQEPEKYLNHSCEANTAVQNFCDVAIKDIKKNEEITGDYSKEMLPNTYLKCSCKSKRCKKIIRN